MHLINNISENNFNLNNPHSVGIYVEEAEINILAVQKRLNGLKKITEVEAKMKENRNN